MRGKCCQGKRIRSRRQDNISNLEKQQEQLPRMPKAQVMSERMAWALAVFGTVKLDGEQ